MLLCLVAVTLMQAWCSDAQAWERWLCRVLSWFSPLAARCVNRAAVQSRSCSQSCGTSAGPRGCIAPLERLHHTVFPWAFCSLCPPHTAQLEVLQSDRSHRTPTLPLLVFVALALQNTLKMSGLPLTPSLRPYQLLLSASSAQPPFFSSLGTVVRAGVEASTREEWCCPTYPRFRQA